jgi:hypothetical protein
MNSKSLRIEIRRAAKAYADKRNLAVDDSHESALIFRNLSDNFHPQSFASISSCPDWELRTRKAHQNVPGVLEMQSSNSSDALLMNIFCHPQIRHWKGVSKLLKEDFDKILFGFPAMVSISGGQQDSTEIDMALTGTFCEAKLTELDFTQKGAEIVEQYDNLHRDFHVKALERNGDYYENYQIIRNLLASIQHNRKHILVCDERRPDLVRRYMETASCLKEVRHRKNCRVVFWQELIEACGTPLQQWVGEKYGMCHHRHVADTNRAADAKH